jgi:photosystem II stability/assembly factor-like uncharacterized protein
MKKQVFLLCLMSFLFPATVCAEWQWMNPTPTGEMLIDWSPVDQQKHFALGTNGFILKTEDAGLTWAGRYAEGYPELIAIDCRDSETFLALAAGGKVLKSKDGGITWELLYQGIDELRDISFVSNASGFAVGEGGVVLSTQDGGSTWFRSVLPTSPDLRKIILLDPDTAIAVCSLGGYWKTLDGGTTWLCYDFSQTKFRDLAFINSRVGYAVCYEYVYGTRYARIYKTEDGGEFWVQKGRLRVSYSEDLSIVFWTDGNGMLLDGNYIYRTVDDGQSFQIVQVLSSGGMGFGAGEGGNVHVYGQGGLLLQSHDEGGTWESAQDSVLPYSGWPLMGGIFVNEEAGFLFDRENIYKTANDGLTWQTALSDEWADFSCLSFPSARIGYASGTRLWATADGGEAWSPIETDFDPGQVQFITERTGFVSEEGSNYCEGAGYGGYGGYGGYSGDECPSGLYVTSDGGRSWTEVPLEPIYGTTFGISSFHFPSSAIGFVARYEGNPRSTKIWRIRETVGLGQWSIELVHQFPGSDIRVLHFRDEAVGIAASGAEIYRTLDGGRNWELVADLGSNYGITGILNILYDGVRKNWYLLTENCLIFTSNDPDGSSWIPLWSPGCMEEIFLHPSSLWGLRYSDSDSYVLRYKLATSASAEEVPPATPLNLEPLDGAAESQTSLLLRASLFQDQNPGDHHAASHWQIAVDPEFLPTSSIFDSGRDEVNLTSYSVAPGLLTYGQIYFFRVRYEDSTNLWSSWSAPTRFFINHPPETPSLNSLLIPADSVYYTTSPVIPFSEFVDQDGDAHSYTEIRVTTGDHYDALVWEHQFQDAVTSATIPGGLLEYERTYFVEVRYKDSSMLWSQWSPPSPIRISMGPKRPENISPAPDGEGEPGSFLEASAFEDDFASHMASEWQICRGEDFLCIVHDTETKESLIRLAMPEVLLQDRIYSWKVRYQNAHGRWSDWSKPTSFAFMPRP